MLCRHCKFNSPNPSQLLKHYHLKHWHHSARRTLHCIYIDCVYTFKPSGALKAHLSRFHCRLTEEEQSGTFRCDLCDFTDICTQKTFFTHLGSHLKTHEVVKCPFKNCVFQTNVHSTFKAHRSRKHIGYLLEDFKTTVLSSGSGHVFAK